MYNVNCILISIEYHLATVTCSPRESRSGGRTFEPKQYIILNNLKYNINVFCVKVCKGKSVCLAFPVE